MSVLKKVQMKLMWKTSIICERQGGLGGRFGHPPGGGGSVNEVLRTSFSL